MTFRLPCRSGIGLRHPHVHQVLAEHPPTGWLEVHSENYFAAAGAARQDLLALRTHYPISLHGVGLSLGSTDALDTQHLDRLRELVDAVQPAAVSEHMCWSSANGVCFNDLLPLPNSREALDLLVARVDAVQTRLQRTIALENVSSYFQFEPQEMPEWEFCARLAQRSGCLLLVDLNNIYVSACNHGFDAHHYLDALPPQSVGQYHLAGHECIDGLLVDTHARPVCDAVWDLYRYALQRIGPRPTLIEWDQDLPALQVLLDHGAKADALAQQEEQHALAG